MRARRGEQLYSELVLFRDEDDNICTEAEQNLGVWLDSRLNPRH